MTGSGAIVRSPQLGIMLQELRDDFIVPLVATAGFNLVIVDMEHGSYSLREVAHLALLCRLHRLRMLVRPPDHEYASIAPVLDAGADGIMAPRVERADQVHKIVAAMKYPPIGMRGMASQRAHTGYLPTVDRRMLADESNERTTLIVQIELAAAIENLDGILSEPGIDFALVGPSDLSLSLGCEPGDETMLKAIAEVVSAGQRHGVRTGLQTGNLAALGRWHREGMSLLVAGTDLALITGAVSECGRRLRATTGPEFTRLGGPGAVSDGDGEITP